ncbi:hypothetical protein BC831DRAFT_484410 [Entophlyctis helioformis]|nr:hypothetical protein BC831DRAFT_484410 [Entophlyctis helioformis]
MHYRSFAILLAVSATAVSSLPIFPSLFGSHHVARRSAAVDSPVFNADIGNLVKRTFNIDGLIKKRDDDDSSAAGTVYEAAPADTDSSDETSSDDETVPDDGVLVDTADEDDGAADDVGTQTYAHGEKRGLTKRQYDDDGNADVTEESEEEDVQEDGSHEEAHEDDQSSDETDTETYTHGEKRGLVKRQYDDDGNADETEESEEEDQPSDETDAENDDGSSEESSE